MYITTNGGANWTATDLPTDYWQGAASSASGEVLAAATYRNQVYISTDGGASWSSSNNPGQFVQSLTSAADGRMLYSFGDRVWFRRYPVWRRLSIRCSADLLCVSWTVPSRELLLQQSLEVTMTNWATLTNTPVLNLTNLQHEVRVSPSESAQFFRLVGP